VGPPGACNTVEHTETCVRTLRRGGGMIRFLVGLLIVLLALTVAAGIFWSPAN
jgi:hypothetical protein